MPGSDRCTPPGNGAGHPDAHRKPESTDRGQGSEEQAGPSRQTNRQGYCSYCRVLYTGLEQHISSSRHRQSVRVSSRGSSTTSSVSRTSRSSSLMDRFLQDVLLHHPYSYTDTRSSHADLPSVSCPPVPRADLAELCVTDSSDSQSVCTRDDLSSSPSEQQQQPHVVMTTELGNQEAGQEKLSQPITRQQEVKRTQPTTHPHTHVKAHAHSLHAHTHALQSPSCTTPSSVHKKAHRKTDRRRETRTSRCSVTPPHIPPDHTSLDHTPKETPSGHKPLDHTPKETPSGHKPLDHTPKETPSGHMPLDLTPLDHPPKKAPLDHSPPHRSPDHAPRGPAPQMWTNWQKERRETHREQMFPTDDITDPVDRTIEEVIQQCYHGDSTSGDQQGEAESFHFSLPESLCSAALTDDWDLHVQEALERVGTDRLHPHSPALHTLPQATPTQPVGTPLPQATFTQDLWVLTEAQVHLDDQVYAHQLDSALHAAPGDLARRRSQEGEEGYRVILPIEQVLPAPAFIPPSFMGKTWAQIEQEDEEKVESMVREFRHGKFICYFDTESLIRYGRRRSQNRMGQCLADGEEHEDDANHLPLANRDEDDPQCTLRRRRRRRLFRLASRCQVVKVSHGTQTAPLVVPAVRQQPLDQQTTNQDTPHPQQAEQEERTPDRLSNVTPLQAQTSLLNVITPLQAQTSLVYILCSPDTGAQLGLHGSSHHKRCRKRRRPLDGRQGTRLKYKPLPLQFYDPLRHCVVSSLPEGWSPLPKGRGIVPEKRGVLRKGRHVRQLFRSLSTELNAERQEGVSVSVGRKRKGGASGSTGVKGRKTSSGTPSKGGDHFLPSMLSADATKTSSNQGTTGGAKEKRGRGGRRTSQSERGSGRGGRRTSQSERGSGRGVRRTSQSEQGSGRGGRRTSQSERVSGRGRRKRPRESSLSPQPRKWSSPRLSESRKAACSTGPLIDSSPSRCLRSGRTRN